MTHDRPAEHSTRRVRPPRGDLLPAAGPAAGGAGRAGRAGQAEEAQHHRRAAGGRQDTGGKPNNVVYLHPAVCPY